MSGLFDWLPDVQFTEYDVSKVEEQLFASYETITGLKLAPGNPERLFLDAVAYEIARLLYLIDFTGKQNLLKYSREDYLDNLGALLNVQRLEAQPARVMVRFELEEASSSVVSIDAGTLITPDGNLLFATSETISLQPGELSARVEAVCETPGSLGNGYLAGQVNQMMQPLPLVSQAVNESMSLGGMDAESDDGLRERISLAPEAFSCAGPSLAYKFHVRTVSQEITDVAVRSPEPGRVFITLLCSGGSNPDNTLIAKVAEALNAEAIRPLTDTVIVEAPEEINYGLEVCYWIAAEYGRLESQVRAKAEAQIAAYLSWQSAALGRSIRPSVLTDYLHNIKGIHHVEVTAPDYTVLSSWQVARCTSQGITYGGLVNG